MYICSLDPFSGFQASITKCLPNISTWSHKDMSKYQVQYELWYLDDWMKRLILPI